MPGSDTPLLHQTGDDPVTNRMEWAQRIGMASLADCLLMQQANERWTVHLERAERWFGHSSGTSCIKRSVT